MEQVEEICDHIVLINLGKKILDGTVSEVKQQFKENAFQLQLHNVPETNADAPFSILHTKDNLLTVKINEGHTGNDVLQYFIRQGIQVEGFNEMLPSLNQVFIKLVEGTNAATRSFQKVEA